jgi:hypothetical protein
MCLKTLVLAASATVMTTAAAEACSYRLPDRTYDEWLAYWSEPHLSQFIRDAAYIEIAVARSHRTAPRSNDREHHLRELFGNQVYTFAISERLRGDAPDMITPSRPFMIAPQDTPDHSPMVEAAQSQFYQYWDLAEPPSPGQESAPTTPCQMEFSFQIGGEYLLLRDVEGHILSAWPIASAEDEWLLAVRTAIASPQADFPWSRPLREHLRHQPWGGEVLTVEDCTRPVTRSAGLFSSDRSRDWVDDGIPPDIESFQDTQQQSPSQRLSEETDAELTERLRADWAYFDSTRYQRFPFDRDTCQVGARYLRLLTYQLFPISDDEIVDFTGYASQMRLTGDMQISLSEVMTLMSEVSGGN